jgi:hypothetical protein
MPEKSVKRVANAREIGPSSDLFRLFSLKRSRAWNARLFSGARPEGGPLAPKTRKKQCACALPIARPALGPCCFRFAAG